MPASNLLRDGVYHKRMPEESLRPVTNTQNESRGDVHSEIKGSGLMRSSEQRLAKTLGHCCTQFEHIGCFINYRHLKKLKPIGLYTNNCMDYSYLCEQEKFSHEEIVFLTSF